MVAVHPQYQRRGLGALLTKPGLDIAEQLQAPVYLEATDRAVKLYQNLGFERLEPGVILGPEIVGSETWLEAPIMVKMPASLGEDSFEHWQRNEKA